MSIWKNRVNTIKELLRFLWQQKLWWMIPMLLVMLMLGVLIAVGSSGGAGPFIYTLF